MNLKEISQTEKRVYWQLFQILYEKNLTCNKRKRKTIRENKKRIVKIKKKKKIQTDEVIAYNRNTAWTEWLVGSNIKRSIS